MPRIFKQSACPHCGEITSTPTPRVNCGSCGQFFDVREQNKKDDRDWHQSRMNEYLSDPYPQSFGEPGVRKVEDDGDGS